MNNGGMKLNKFLYIFVVFLTIYLILDFVFSNALLYIVGGVVGGSIALAFKSIGVVNAGLALVCLVWVFILIGVVILFNRLQSKNLKLMCAVLISLLLYVIDMSFSEALYAVKVEPNNVLLLSKVMIAFLALLKALVLSLIVFFGFKRD